MNIERPNYKVVEGAALVLEQNLTIQDASYKMGVSTTTIRKWMEKVQDFERDVKSIPSRIEHNQAIRAELIAKVEGFLSEEDFVNVANFARMVSEVNKEIRQLADLFAECN